MTQPDDTPMVSVPREPTEAMHEAGQSIMETHNASDVWSAMIAASPPLAEGGREQIARIIAPDAERLAEDAAWAPDRRAAREQWADALAKADAILALYLQGN